MNSDCTKLSFDQIPQFSKRDIAYQVNNDEFAQFYEYKPELDSFEQKINDRKKHPIDRKLLTEVLADQYQNISISTASKNNIASLSNENTFTIVTAHQLSLLTGPLYYITKIVSCIRLTQKLKAQYKDYNFVPVFVHGGEDHDFEEVDHMHLFGKTLKWNSKETGPVGRFSKEGLQGVIDELKELLTREQHYAYIENILDGSFNEATDYKGFVIRLVQALFNEHGLIQLNMDNPKLKRAFIPIIKKELTERASQELVQVQQDKLDQLGYKSQAHPRDINLFLLDEGSRDRITFEDNKYHIVDKNQSYTESEILNILNTSPERFSPNVVVRPLYQEYILPNLAYVGGGGELAYWLERKTQFKFYNISYPILVRRDSILILDKSSIKQIQKLEFKKEDIFQSNDEMIHQFIHAQTDDNIDLSKYIAQNNQIFKDLSKLAQAADPSLKNWVLSEQTKQEKVINQIEGRIKRAYKSREEINVNKITKLKDKLFPNNGMQERYDNSLPWIAKYGQDYISALMKHLNPLDKSFKIITIE